jgi:hypothetical protein
VQVAHAEVARGTPSSPERRRHRAPLGAHPRSRHIQVRDRTCVAPGCRRPAHHCDADHTPARRSHAYTEGGDTTEVNVGPLCPRHHALKHCGGWWQLRRPAPATPLAQPTRRATHDPRRADHARHCPRPSPAHRLLGPLLPNPATSMVLTYPAWSAPPRSSAETVPSRRHSLWKRPPSEDPEDPAPSEAACHRVVQPTLARSTPAARSGSLSGVRAVG